MLPIYPFSLDFPFISLINKAFLSMREKIDIFFEGGTNERKSLAPDGDCTIAVTAGSRAFCH